MPVLTFLVFCFCTVLFITGVSAVALSTLTGEDDRKKWRRREWRLQALEATPETRPSRLGNPKAWPLRKLLALTHPVHGAGFVLEYMPTRVYLGSWESGQKQETWKDYPSTSAVLEDGWCDA